MRILIFSVLILVSGVSVGNCKQEEDDATKSSSTSKAEGKKGKQITSTNPFTPVHCPPNNPAWNRMIALQYAQSVVDLNPGVLSNYVAPDLIQHTADSPDGLAALQASISPGGQLATNFGSNALSVAFEHVGAVEDYVWLHLRMTNDIGHLTAGFELLRFECGLIKEHWEMYQPINTTAPVYNKHPYF